MRSNGKILRLLAFVVYVAFTASCATIEQPTARDGLSYQASKAVDKAHEEGKAPTGGPDDTISLDKSMDKYHSSPMKLVDDDTGKTLIVCKWVTPRGTRFPKKICATKEEWDAMRQANRRDAEEWQRSLRETGSSAK